MKPAPKKRGRPPKQKPTETPAPETVSESESSPIEDQEITSVAEVKEWAKLHLEGIALERERHIISGTLMRRRYSRSEVGDVVIVCPSAAEAKTQYTNLINSFKERIRQ